MKTKMEITETVEKEAGVNALGGESEVLEPINNPDFLGEEANYFWLHVVSDADGRPLAVARLGAVRASVRALRDFRR